jgi:tetratricopeptide (TPR) repeat protein
LILYDKRLEGRSKAQISKNLPFAENRCSAGEVEEGLAVVAEAVEFVVKTGERMAEAELHRVKGELLSARTPADQAGAEASFRDALEIARRQRAKLWELRAAMSLARLWQRQGRKDEARELLAPVYDWFTEGFDTRDLKEAKALLDDLAWTYSGMGRYHKQQGNTEQAREYLTKALEIFERLGTLIEPDKVREELADLG